MVSLTHTSFPVDREFVTEAIIIKSIGHPLRIKILNEIQTTGYNVTRICEALGIQQAVASHHLAVLKDAGVVTGNRKGTEVFYTIESSFVKRLLSVLCA